MFNIANEAAPGAKVKNGVTYRVCHKESEIIEWKVMKGKLSQ